MIHVDIEKDLPGIPAGSRICNVAYAENDGYFTMNALEPLAEQSTAPIYAYTNDHVISTIVPGTSSNLPPFRLPTLHIVRTSARTGEAVEVDSNASAFRLVGDLGIPVLRHIHQCWPHYAYDADGKYQLFLLVHGWNKVYSHAPVLALRTISDKKNLAHLPPPLHACTHIICTTLIAKVDGSDSAG